MLPALFLLLLGIGIGWHLSSFYHNRQWTRALCTRADAMVKGVYRLPAPRPELHADQDCAGDLPPDPGFPPGKAVSLRLHAERRLDVRHLRPCVRWRDNRPTFDATPYLWRGKT